MTTLRGLLAALVLLHLAACGGGGGGGSGGGGGGGQGATLQADVYPLATGDRRSWIVTAGTPSGRRYERVEATVTTSQGSAFPVRDETGATTDYLQRTTTAIVSVPGPGSDPLSVALGAVEVLRFGITMNQTVRLYERTVSFDADGDGRVDSVDVRVDSTYVGDETVDTPAGRFTAAAHVRTDAQFTARLAGQSRVLTIALTGDDWYAPGVGPVQSSSRTVVDGIQTENLTEALDAYGVGARRSETVAPTLQSASPAAGAYMEPGGQFELTFSEALDPLSVADIALIDAAGNAVAATPTITASGTQVTLRPNALLADGRYELRLPATLTDRAGNPLAAQVRSATVDTRGPRVVSATPANGSTEAPLTGTIALVFDEPVFASGGSAVRLRVADIGNVDVRSLAATIDGSRIVATLDAPLQRNRDYFIELDSPIVDARGQPAQALGGSVRFRTDPGPLARPQVLMDNAAVLAVTTGDVDGDGRSDIVLLAQQLGTSQYFVAARLQRADGSHAPALRLATVAEFGICQGGALLVADLDQDGRNDIVVASCPGPVLLRRQADGSYQSESITATVNPRHLAAIDIDGDGRAELVAADFTGIQFLRRTAAGAWTQVLRVDGGTDLIVGWTAADVNGDGRPDLLWLRNVGNTDTELAWALRQGNGFGPTTALSLGRNALAFNPALAVADFSGDGRADVALTMGAGIFGEPDNVVLITQRAGGAFDAPQLLATYFGPGPLAVGDLDGDGRADLVVGHTTGPRIGVYLQAAGGGLQAERLFEAASRLDRYSELMVVVDVDGNGRRDVVSAGDVLLGRPTTGAWPLQAPAGGSALQMRAAEAPSSRWLRALRTQAQAAARR